MTTHAFYELSEQNALAKVRKIGGDGFTHGYCQFTGGGDIYLDAKQETLVVSKGCEGDGSTTPIDDGTSISTISIEGGKGDYDIEQLKYQLLTNTVLISVTSFVK